MVQLNTTEMPCMSRVIVLSVLIFYVSCVYGYDAGCYAETDDICTNKEKYSACSVIGTESFTVTITSDCFEGRDAPVIETYEVGMMTVESNVFSESGGLDIKSGTMTLSGSVNVEQFSVYSQSIWNIEYCR